MYRKKIVAVLTTALMFSLVACGKDTEESTSVDSEPTEESSEEIPTETKSAVPYVEENGLTFTDRAKVQTKGTLCVGEDTDNADIIDVDWEIANISISDAEDDVKTITIEQNVYGYIWTDGDIFKTNLNLPSAMLCDIYTGKIIPLAEESTTTEIEWEEKKYSIETTESVFWEDGDWDNDWVEDSNGGERLSSTLKVTDTIKVSKDYDGLALVLIPITDANDSNIGSYIKDIWKDGSYLFDVNDMSSTFKQIKDGEIAESEEEKEEMKQEETKSAETSKPKETTVPKEEDTKTAHTHNYTSTISIQPTCTTNGQKVFKCEICGDSYTENLGTTAHDFSIPIIQTVHHDEVWQNVPRQTSGSRVIICGCGAEFATQADFDNHRIASLEANGPFCSCCGPFNVEDRPGETVYDYVKVADAYDSEEVIGYKCSVCGATATQ